MMDGQKLLRMPPLTDQAAASLKSLADHWDFWPYEAVIDSFATGNVLALAIPDEENKHWLGFILLSVGDSTAEILYIYTAPTARRLGLGRRMLRAALQQLAESCQSLFLEVRPKNTAACQLYRAEGFVEIGRRKAYYRDGEDALILKRSIT